MSNYKVFNTKDLIKINKNSIKRGRNRTLTNSFIMDIDPKGTHVVALSFLHNDCEIRTLLMCKMMNSDAPSEVMLDMSIDEFNNAYEMVT